MVSLPAAGNVALFSLKPGLYSLFFYKMLYMEEEIYDRASFQKFLNLDTFSPHARAVFF
jgi:hypothetical protein